MNRVTVVIPWRPQPSRIDAFERVTDWYRSTVPQFDLRTIDSDDPVFNLAHARNLAVASIADPDDVVILADADTLPEHDALLSAVEGAATVQRVHLPYTEYRWLGAVGSAQYAAGVPLIDCSCEIVHGACSGVYVTTGRTWALHGGQDARFRGWGFEDAAWNLAHTTLFGEPPVRHEGRVYALHHEAAARFGAQYDANAALMQRYREVAGDRLRMAQLVDARDTASSALTGPGV